MKPACLVNLDSICIPQSLAFVALCWEPKKKLFGLRRIRSWLYSHHQSLLLCLHACRHPMNFRGFQRFSLACSGYPTALGLVLSDVSCVFTDLAEPVS